jgi:hypothetical protein
MFPKDYKILHGAEHVSRCIEIREVLTIGGSSQLRPHLSTELTAAACFDQFLLSSGL